MLFKQLFVSILLLALSTKQAHAYLDPGSGSYLFQILVGGLLGSIFIFKNYGSALVEAFNKKIRRKNTDSDDKNKLQNSET